MSSPPPHGRSSTPLPKPCLCLVTDRTAVDPETMVSRIVQAVEGGVDLVQLREKDLPGGPLLALAQSIAEAIGDRAALVVNERIDIAMAVGAVGVQLGEEAAPIPAARRILGPGFLIGRSVHSVEGAVLAQGQGADFLVAGAMYASNSHPGAEPAGPTLVRHITQACTLPVIGIGGITADNLDDVMAAGACGVAVITSILAAPDPGEAAKSLKRALVQAWDSRRPLDANPRRV